MITLTDYQILDHLYESTFSLVYRARRKADGQAVVLKILKDAHPTPEQLALFKQEYKILSQLEIAGVIEVYELRRASHWVMVLQDFGGQSLAQLRLAGKLTWPDFLELAIKISEVLGQLHDGKIIHKDINPSNIILNPASGELKLIDFGISTKFSLETPRFYHPKVLEGTLAYISPEQTGRMNRVLDYRSDFYSLGVTFYELLTGQLPFQSDDTLELIHSHIAKPPQPPHELKADMPPILSQIVLKLMAKNAEERYQSAYGLKADLQASLHQWQSSGQMAFFELGEQDLSDRLNIPSTLYGRSEETATLLAAFERACQGGSEMMLVTGYSGVGKSALVQEVYRGLMGKQGHFIAGKFDQYQRNVPYSALTQAFNELCGQLLSEPPLVLNEWQAKIKAAVGRNGQLLSDVIPNLQWLIGEQPTVPQVGTQEAQNRFHLLFQAFIQAICSPEHPLVLFIDDLQWADSASLSLMKRVMHDPESQYLLLIGAYRDNEVDGSHPLAMTIEAIKEQKISIKGVQLNNLSKKQVNALIAETLHVASDYSQPLSDLVYAKTQGNAFFTREFLKSLYDDGFLRFDPLSRGWQWDVAQIQAQNITDNVVELMAGKIGELAANTQTVLQLAACIGNLFELSTLALISQKSLPLLVAELWPAVEEGLLVPLDEQYKLLHANLVAGSKVRFKFQHDRVQQAAYSLIDEAQKQASHLSIGRLLLANTTQQRLAEDIFEMVNQFNQGIGLINRHSERVEVAKLNLLAGKRAKKATAYGASLTYLKVAQELLSCLSRSEAGQHELRFNLYIEHAEVACLSGDFSASERICEVALQQAKSVEEKVKVVEIQIQLNAIQNQLQQAINRALDALTMLGVRLLDSPPPDLNVAKLYNLPEMSDPHQLAGLRLLNKTLSVFYIARPELVPAVVFTMLDLSVKGGHSPFAPMAYVSYGLMLSGFMGEIEAGYQFGKLGLSLLDKFEAGSIRSRVQYVFLGMIVHWKEHAQLALEPLRENIHYCIENGETEYAGYTILCYFQSMIWCGHPLDVVYQKQLSYLRLIQALKQDISLYNAQIWVQFVQNLRGEGPHKAELIGEFFNEIEMIPHFIEVDNRNSLMGAYLAKVMLGYFFRDYAQAVANASLVKSYEGSLAGLLLSVQCTFYHSLALLALYATVEPKKQVEALKEVSANQQKMSIWATHAPMNFQYKFDLVEAEKERVLGHHWAAAELYEEAIKGARDNDYLHEEALAYELAAEFYLVRGFEKIGISYLIEAHYGYQLWQAGAKVQQLEERYPQWLTKRPAKHQTPGTLSATSSTTQTATTSGGTLDLGSLLKASQAISSEIILTRLLEKMMKIVIENAGAERGLLLLSTKDQWFIEAESSVYQENQASSLILQAIPIAQKPLKLSTAIVHYVIRTKQALILNDAPHEGAFQQDHYVRTQQPKSILCMPLLHQGQVKGLLYLENNLNRGTFTPDRVELLRLLSSQMTVSLDNARLYNNLEELVEQRTIELREAKKEADVAKERAEAANQAKSDFLSNMSHELRTPLNGILGYTQILKRDQALKPKQKNALNIIHESGHHLLTLINDILDLSKIEARKMDLYPQDVHLSSLLKMVQGIIRMRAEEKQVRFVYERDERLPAEVQADEKRLRQVLINLLGNAVKFTERGQVTLKVSRQDNQSQNQVTLRFEIIDTGVGMTAEQLATIFLPFEQVGEAKQHAQGTGLGLAITRQLVNLMGGEVQVESKFGQGSRFWFDLTLPVVSSKEKEPEKEKAHIEQTTEDGTINLSLVPPPAEELEVVYELASLGKMSGLRKKMAYIEQLDEKYTPFADKVRQLARDFEDDKIVALVETYL